MIMQDQSRRLSQPLRWGRREKTIVGILVACVVLGLVGLGAFSVWGGSPARKDCVSLTFASTLGGGRLHACGAEGRSICASAASYRAYGADLRSACARAGFATPRR